MDVLKPILARSREATGPWSAVAAPSEQYVKGVLLLVPQGARINIIRRSDRLEDCQDQQAGSLAEACRLLLTREFNMVVVLPGALRPMDEVSVAILRNMAQGAPVLVLSDNTLSPIQPGTSIDQASKAVEPPNKTFAADHSVFGPVPSNTVAVGPIIGYRASGMIAVGGKPLKLSVTQDRILWRLLEAPQNRCTLTDLIETMPNPGFSNARNTLRVHIHRLRSRLEAHGASRILASGSGSYWLHWPLAVTRPVSHRRPAVQQSIKSRSAADRAGLPG